MIICVIICVIICENLCDNLCDQVERQSSFGCYHPEAAGLLPNDVHVIDLRDRTGSGQNGRRLRRSTKLPEVVVELGPELTEGEFSNWPQHQAYNHHPILSCKITSYRSSLLPF